MEAHSPQAGTSSRRWGWWDHTNQSLRLKVWWAERETALFVGDGEGMWLFSSCFHPLRAGAAYPDVLAGHYTTWSFLLSFFITCPVSTLFGNMLGHLIERLIGFVTLDF